MQLHKHTSWMVTEACKPQAHVSFLCCAACVLDSNAIACQTIIPGDCVKGNSYEHGPFRKNSYCGALVEHLTCQSNGSLLEKLHRNDSQADL
eukprot:5206891-Amphidinium_carterae.1